MVVGCFFRLFIAEMGLFFGPVSFTYFPETKSNVFHKRASFVTKQEVQDNL
jgi:hypothetical protein